MSIRAAKRSANRQGLRRVRCDECGLTMYATLAQLERTGPLNQCPACGAERFRLTDLGAAIIAGHVGPADVGDSWNAECRAIGRPEWQVMMRGGRPNLATEQERAAERKRRAETRRRAAEAFAAKQTDPIPF